MTNIFKNNDFAFQKFLYNFIKADSHFFLYSQPDLEEFLFENGRPRGVQKFFRIETDSRGGALRQHASDFFLDGFEIKRF